MNNEELFLLFGFIGFLLSLLVLIKFFINSNSALSSYLTKRRWSNISWMKVLKYWAICQGFILFSKMNSIYEERYFIILTPIVLLLFLLVYYLSYNSGPIQEYGEEKILDQEYFQNYKKSFQRQKKIDKIIKRF
jgi:hypothetical protein